MKENKVFHSDYAEARPEIENFIENFKSAGSPIGQGNRNEIKVFQTDAGVLNIKSFKIPNIFNQFIYAFFRKSKARRSFENAVYLQKKGIGTPQPLAFYEYFRGIGLKESFYVSLQQDCDITFRELITNPHYPDRDNIIEQFTAFTFSLHQNNILFKDHSPGNTLIKKENNKYHFFLVDLNRMKFKKLSFEERLKNFARLTPKREMVKAISETYAGLIDKNKEEVFEKMWQYTQDFQKAYYRKRNFKKKILFRK